MFRQLRPALVAVVGFMVLCGLVFPAVVTGLGRALFPRQAGGSLVVRDGVIVGSALVGQSFVGPGYFHGRPSAAGAGYDGAASGGTNLGPTSDKLIHGVHLRLPDGSEAPGGFAGVADLAAAYRLENGLPAGAPVPPDAVTRSASGLDPHITPANAALQTPRVARARGLAEAAVRAAVARHTQGRQLGVLGEPRVDVLALNLELDRIAAGAAAGTAR
jgi:potassium-transporting ATPase KdpC subunit